MDMVDKGLSTTVIFSGTDEPFQVERVSVPDLRSGEILVRVEFVTLCRSDLNTYCGKRQEKTPTILGHEIVGRVVALGPDTAPRDRRGAFLRIGDRVTWAIYAGDPNSEAARRGFPQKAPGYFKYGHERVTEDDNLHGGLAEYIVLRRNTVVVKVGEHVPLSVAALINCSVATVAGAFRLARELRNRQVLVNGAGMLGLVACAMARTAGAREVWALDLSADRLETARQFGATHTRVAQPDGPSAWPDGHDHPGFDTIFELTGIASATEQAFSHLGLGGVLILVGATYPERGIQLDAEQVVRKLLTIKGLHNYRPDDLVRAVDFIEHHYESFPFQDLIVGDYPLEQAEAAFRYALKENPFRVGLRIS